MPHPASIPAAPRPDTARRPGSYSIFVGRTPADRHISRNISMHLSPSDSGAPMSDRFGRTWKPLVRAALAATLVLAGLALPAPAGAAVSRAALALRWAPIHYQDVDVTGGHALGGLSDYITRVD